MRAGLFFITSVLLTAQMMLASPGYGQENTDRIVTLKFQNEDLVTVLQSIQSQADLTISYESTIIKDLKKITISKEKIKVADALNLLLSENGLQWKFIDDVIWVLPKFNSGATPGGALKYPALLTTPPITGVVTNADGQPLAGASVKIKGSNVGVVTDAGGKFSINAENGQVLVISYVGFADQEIAAKEGSIYVKLNASNNPLDEVVFKGYYTESKRLNTGNVSKISSSEIEKQPVANPLQALQGRVPGINIEQQTGVPGGGFKVQIRGINSIAGGNDPFYIVDGIPFTNTTLATGIANSITPNASPLNSININDIESIEILKDADATAIYGSRGANGVVLITTKKGKAGKTTFNLDIKSGAGKIARKMDLLNTEQYLEMRNEGFLNDNRTPTQANAPDLLIWDQTAYTDWQKELIGGTAKQTSGQLSLSGGSNTTQYLLSGGYFKETTVFPANLFDEKGSVNISVGHLSADKRFKSVFSGFYVSDRSNLNNYDLTAAALTMVPNAPEFRDVNGKLLYPSPSLTNPYADLDRKFKALSGNLLGNLSLQYYIMPNTDVKVHMGYNIIERNETEVTPQSTITPGSSTLPSSRFGNTRYRSWSIEPQIGWKKNIGSFKIDVLAGTSFQEILRNGQTLRGTGYSDETLMGNIQGASTINVEDGIYSRYRYNGFFTRANFNYQDRYLINATARRDGSSRFGSNKQFTNFGAVGAAWIFSNETFFKNTILSYGKLRASYGITGNDQIGDYQYLELYTPTDYPYQNNGSLYPTRIANPDYAWEINKKLEIGLEIGLAKDRILASTSFYRNRSSNQLVGYPLPPSVGFETMQANLAALVQNKGWEFQLTSNNIKSKRFSWITNFNISIPTTFLKSFPGIENTSYNSVYEVGKPLTTVKAFHYLGMDAATGLYNFEDLDGDASGITDPADLQTFKKLGPVFYGGFANSFSYGGISFEILFQFTRQDGFNYMAGSLAPGFLSNQPVFVLDRWQKPGDEKPVQRYTVRPTTVAYRMYSSNNDNKISDASYIRLKNISISYSFKKELLSHIKMENCQVYIQGQNLLTITDYRGMDPENLSMFSLPPLKMIVAGIRLGF